MKAFKDSAGRVWQIEITIDAVKRVRDLLGLDLLDQASDTEKVPAITKIGTDIVALIDTIFVILKPQADAANISDVDFARAIGGRAALDAQTAFYEELADFFQSMGRPDKTKIVLAQKTMIELTIQRLEMVVQVDPQKEVEKIFGNLSLNSAE